MSGPWKVYYDGEEKDLLRVCQVRHWIGNKKVSLVLTCNTKTRETEKHKIMNSKLIFGIMGISDDNHSNRTLQCWYCKHKYNFGITSHSICSIPLSECQKYHSVF